MIIAKVNDQVHRIYMVDAHSHIGSDIDGVSNPNPMAAFGTFDFYAKTYAEIVKVMGGDTWKFNARGANYEFKIVPNPPVHEIIKQAAALSEQYSKLYEKFENTWLFDYGVGFPFQDKYRSDKPEALYRASNERIASVVTKFPLSLRMIGYCRVHPDEGEKAINEIRNGAKLGLRGLKLHPRSEGWLDHVNTPQAVNVLVEAARHSMPVIFDTRGKETIYTIYDLARNAKSYIERSEPALLPHLKVIIGHCAAGNMDDARMYQAVSDTNTYGELSMVRSPEFDQFIIDFMRKSPAGKAWSQHILFGSDFPYFFERHAKDIISFMLSKSFYDQGGTIEDTKNILGMNLLRLLPDFNKQVAQQATIPKPVAVHARPVNGTRSIEVLSKVIIKMVDSNDVEITRLVPMFRDNFNNYRNEFLLGTRWNVNGTPNEVLMVAMNVFGDMMGLGPIGNNGEWKKFGFAYFDEGGFDALDAFTTVNLVDPEKPENALATLKSMFVDKSQSQQKLKPLKPPMKGPAMKPVKPIKPMKPAA